GGRWIINFWAWHPDSAELKKRIFESLPEQNWQPETAPTLHQPALGGRHWRYAVAEEDQVIDFSIFNLTPALMEGWVYAGLESPTAQTVNAELLTIGPARLWLNGKIAFDYHERFSYVAIQQIPVT